MVNSKNQKRKINYLLVVKNICWIGIMTFLICVGIKIISSATITIKSLLVMALNVFPLLKELATKEPILGFILILVILWLQLSVAGLLIGIIIRIYRFIFPEKDDKN